MDNDIKVIFKFSFSNLQQVNRRSCFDSVHKLFVGLYKSVLCYIGEECHSFLLVYILYRTSGVIFFHRLLHSYRRHIERGSRGERDIVPSTQDGGHAYVA